MTTRHSTQLVGDAVPYAASSTGNQPGGATRSTRTWRTPAMTMSPAMLQAQARAEAEQQPVITMVGRP